MRLPRRRATASGVSLGRARPPRATAELAAEVFAAAVFAAAVFTAELAETAGGTPGAADVTDASLLGVVVERAPGVVAEHVVQRGPGPERGLEHARGTGGADRARLHE